MLNLTVLLGYAVAALALFVSLRFDRETSSPLTPASVGALLGLGAAILHARALYAAVLRPEGWLLNVPNVLSLFAWQLGLLAVIAAASRELRVVSLPLFVIAGAGALLTGRGTEAFARTEPALELKIHALLSLLAFGLLAAAAVVAVFLLFQDRRLRHGHVNGWLGTLPPLFVTERLLFSILAGGWGLLTLSLASGFLFIDNMFNQHLAHKTLLSLLGWVILSVLLVGHRLRGWRGRRTVHWVLGSFALLIVAYFGSKAILEDVLGRTWG